MPRPPAPQLRLGPVGHSEVPAVSTVAWQVGGHNCDVGWLILLTSESLGARSPSLISLVASAPGSIGQGILNEGD